jgi:large repetitive protein
VLTRSLRGKIWRWLPVAVTVVVAAAVIAYAVLAVGFPVRNMSLNDTGVWISNDAGGEYGRINKAVGALDARLSPPGQRVASYQLDILQDGNAVLGWDQSNAALTRIDTATGASAVDEAVGVDSSSSVDFRGGTLAVMDRAGRVWATRYDELTGKVDVSAVATSSTPLAELGLAADAAAGSAALAVGTDGTVFVAGVNGKLITIHPDSAGGFSKAEVAEGRPTLKSISLTAVGSQVVALDTVAAQLVLPSGNTMAVDVDQVSRLQQPGPTASAVLVASAKALLRVNLDSGQVATVDAGGDGAPAAPVRLSGCDFGAWAGVGRVVRACDNAAVEVQQVDRTGGLIRPAFRINHGLLLLNDQANGRAYDLDAKASVDDWPDVNPQGSQQQEQKKTSEVSESKPNAVDDDLFARTERTTVLHVLDNDTDTGGGILSIKSISPVSVPDGADIEISPDGQTVKLYLPKSISQVRFKYVVSDGQVEDDANVTVSDAGDRETVPYLRAGGGETQYSAPSFGNLSIPVATDWRDREGDPVTVLSASGEQDAAIPVTAAGQIDYTAESTTQDVVRTINYLVSDGAAGKTVKGSVKVKVLGSKSTTTISPIAEPDVVRGEVGKAITVFPLSNDVDGADPQNLNAKLTLNAPVAQKANVEVTTDQASGRVTVVASREGPYFLEYSVAFGNSAAAKGTIRVDAVASGADNPVAMPDQAAVRGQAPVVVDVLANDYDPSGDLLTVQSATAVAADQLQVEVVAGRWLRILPQAESLSPNPQAVHYTVSNGSQTATGDVLVTQLGEISQDEALARADAAVVRAGDSVLVSVLANDTSLSGQSLHLVTDGLGTDHDGQLPVVDPAKAADADQGDVGQAFVRGDQIRYVAPASTDGVRQVVISYTVSTSSGDTAESQVVVTINPEPTADSPDQAPVGSTVEMRVVSGSRVKISVPTTGQDPDGDSVTVTGIASAPVLGRIVGISQNSLTYEAYPTAGLVGTDTFTYVVTDKYGRTGQGSIRVGVTEPGQTQAPVAIDDQITAAPGADVQVDVASNDYIARDDDVRVASLSQLNQSLPAGVSLAADAGPIQAKAPGLAEQPVLLNYALTGNGGTGPAATVKITSKEGFNNPPTVADQAAEVDGGVGKANLLADAADIDGKVTDLKVSLLATVTGATLVGGELSVPLLDHPQVIPFQVTDAGGAVSAAVVFVPAAGVGAPKLKSDASIQLATNATSSFAIADYVESPRGKVVRISSASIAASPTDYLDAKVDDNNRFTLTSKTDYVGPASVTVEVMDADSQTADGVLISTVTIPVQVGDRTPVLRCPTDAQSIVQGGEIKDLDITTLCHVWSPDPDSLAGLTYSATWEKSIDKVSATGGAHKVKLQAEGGAAENATGTLTIGIEGTAAKTATLQVTVTPASAPGMRSVKFTDIKAGTPVAVQVALNSPLLNFQSKVVKLEKISGGDATATSDGGTATITPGVETSGTLVYRVTATDLASDPTRETRWVTGTITLVVYSRPGAPGAPVSGAAVQSHSAALSWSRPAANGAAIDSYEVKVASGPGAGQVTTCRSNQCQIKGLANGKPLTFQVRAHNKADWSDWSPSSAQITPDTPPGAPAWVKVSNPEDHSVLVTWGSISNDGSAIKTIHVTVNGVDHTTGAGASSLKVSTSSNNEAYNFGVFAENSYKPGPVTTARGQSSGKPAGLSVAAPSPASSVGATTSVKVSWSLGSAEGPSPVSYDVVRNDGKKICSDTTATTCTDDTVRFDGTSYSYTVTATNATGGSAHSSSANSSTWKATGTPDAWANWTAAPTGSDGKVKITYTVPASRGSSSTVTISGAGGTTSLGTANVNGETKTTTISGLTDGTSYTMKLKVCNEANRCSSSATHTATPFGPLDTPNVTASHSGDEVTGKATGNGNGATATLTLYIDGAKAGSTSGKGALSITKTKTVGYSTKVTVKATLTSSSTTPARADKTATTTETTGAAPAKSAYLWIGSVQYGVGGDSWKHVYLRTTGFTSTYTCTIWDTLGNASGTHQFTTNVDGYYIFDIVVDWTQYVSCDGVKSNKVIFDNPHG